MLQKNTLYFKSVYENFFLYIILNRRKPTFSKKNVNDNIFISKQNNFWSASIYINRI